MTIQRVFGRQSARQRSASSLRVTYRRAPVEEGASIVERWTSALLPLSPSAIVSRHAGVDKILTTYKDCDQ
jgi:hypothetical protein